MEQRERIIVADTPDYFGCIDEFRMAGGEQMLLCHITVHRFTPSVFKEIKKVFFAFRSCTDAPLFAFEPEPEDEKWERFITSLNFSYAGRVSTSWDGRPRRFFMSVPDHARKDLKDRDQLQLGHLEAAGSAVQLPPGRLE